MKILCIWDVFPRGRRSYVGRPEEGRGPCGDAGRRCPQASAEATRVGESEAGYYSPRARGGNKASSITRLWTSGFSGYERLNFCVSSQTSLWQFAFAPHNQIQSMKGKGKRTGKKGNSRTLFKFCTFKTSDVIVYQRTSIYIKIIRWHEWFVDFFYMR